MGRLAARELTSLAALDALRTGWSALHARDPRATPFHAPEWLAPWWRRFAHGELCAIALEDEGRLAGFAPLYLEPVPGGPRVSLVGTGITDYLGPLVEPGFEDALGDAVDAALDSRAERWTRVELEQLRPGDALLGAGAAEPQDPCVVVRLADFEQRLSPRLRSRLHGRYARRLQALGAVRFELADERRAPEFLGALFRLHEARRVSQGLASGLDGDPRMAAFHDEVAHGFLERGWLRLHAIRLEDELVAVLYAIHCGGRAYAYLSGWDPRLANFSPGALLVHRAMTRAADEGLSEFDFLRGDEDYKQGWGGETRWNYRRLIFRNDVQTAETGLEKDMGADRDMHRDMFRGVGTGSPFPRP